VPVRASEVIRAWWLEVTAVVLLTGKSVVSSSFIVDVSRKRRVQIARSR
jgi:hypothetical protein